jgi:3-dehydroquinate dehydratase-1
MKPKICGVIAVKSIQDADSTINNPQTKNCDLIELRLDYLVALDTNEITTLLNSLEVSTILTLRSQTEGGKFRYSEVTRLKTLKQLIQLQPSYIDLEMSIDEGHLFHLIKEANRKNVKTILSTHFFEKTPTMPELIERLKFGTDHGADIVKIVAFAQRIDDNDTILALNRHGKEREISIIAFCMGPLGLPSRILCVYREAVFTYAALNQQSAPGQLNVQTMRKFYDILEERGTICK